ncbi:cell division protein DivIC (FtsB), stabilizes FtsL against RasP cleavage [Nonlabens marinus S1-08]|uniref:Cell division protein DivIC (FtsB), stabilizes FtsL against RasP cleavage n=1 Tax=Nonlabens marinus S1-08 TaxID=1454201 RepID=W8VQR2_9FLAO|nr:cell division protein DivIC (FtsB), stabilizes FtsL against RasP cleavage [Nonlabens marinus S1-08]
MIAIVLLFILAFFFERLEDYLVLGFFILIGLLVVDLFLLYLPKSGVMGSRVLPDKFSNGDENPVEIRLRNNYSFKASYRIIDELPVQFQKRDFKIETTPEKGKAHTLTYTARPVERGEFHFGSLNVFVKSGIGLVWRKYIFDHNAMVPNYPSFLQMRKYELMAFTNKLKDYGMKKIRRIGHTMEFEQIKDYTLGDDVRNINWKATAKRNQLMINQFQDEKSQPVYSVIDKGRVMKMPFEGLKLVDYAINATLVISNIALKKGDKAGMFSFSSKVDNQVMAQKRSSQMNLILETLYNLETDFRESDFSRLYIDIKRKITQRSLLLLYTNFETLDALHRQLPYLQAIAKNHLLVVVFFENTELSQMLEEPVENTQDIFTKTIAEKFAYEKKLIVNELNKFGIQTILTKPQELTVNTINKYLEIKARGLL